MGRVFESGLGLLNMKKSRKFAIGVILTPKDGGGNSMQVTVKGDGMPIRDIQRLWKVI